MSVQYVHTFSCCWDHKVDFNAHNLGCVQCEYKEKALCWVMGYNGPLQQISPGSGDCHRPAPAPAVQCLWNLFGVKFPRVTQRTSGQSKSRVKILGQDGPDRPLCESGLWANMIRVYNICKLGAVWPSSHPGQPSHLEASLHDSWWLPIILTPETHSFPPAPRVSENTASSARCRQAWKGWEPFKWRTWD